MRRITFFKSLIVAIVLVVGSANSWGQTLLAGWDFQTTANGGTAIAASPNSPNTFVANVGTGTLYLNGSNGSSTWITATTGNEVSGFTGTNINASNGLSTTTTSPACLAIVGGGVTGNYTANGKFMVFKISMTGKTNLTVSYASQKTSTGFSSHIWEYSTDGTTWTAAQTISSIATSFALITLNTITGLDNAANAYLRFSASGATAVSGNNRLDNILLVTSSVQSVAAPVLSATPGNVITPQSITLSSATPGASIYYTTDGTVPDNVSHGILYDGITPITVNVTTTLKAIAYSAGMTTSTITTGIYTFPSIISNISALRTASLSGFYKLTGEAYLTFQSTAGKVKYIQDATAGIVIYDGSGKITTGYNVGDGIKDIYCTLSMFNGMLELIPFSDPGVANSTGNTVSPTQVTLSNLASYPAQLVKVKDVTITGTGNYASNILYPITDVTAGNLRPAYTDLNYITTAIPVTVQDITGVVLNYSLTEVDLVPRSSSDFTPSLGNGISKIATDSKIYASEGCIILSAIAGESIQIFNSTGQRLIQKLAVEGTNSIAVSAKGVVLVKVGDRFAKVIL